jgi:hypothetical protein
MPQAGVSLVVVSLLGVSCGRAAIEPSQSLVGANDLPSPRVLSREIVQINRGVGGPHFLSYELRPDNTLAITLSERGVKGEAVRGKETFNLSSELAEHTRRMLWRVRPAKLQGIEYETRPVGCEPRGPHDFGELVVVFINEGDQVGIKDDHVGVFALPHVDSCRTKDAEEARQLLRQVSDALPESRVAAEFDRRV